MTVLFQAIFICYSYQHNQLDWAGPCSGNARSMYGYSEATCFECRSGCQVKLPQAFQRLFRIYVIPESCQELRAYSTVPQFDTASLNSTYAHLITGTDVTWCAIMPISDVLYGFRCNPNLCNISGEETASPPSVCFCTWVVIHVIRKPRAHMLMKC